MPKFQALGAFEIWRTKCAQRIGRKVFRYRRDIAAAWVVLGVVDLNAAVQRICLASGYDSPIAARACQIRPSACALKVAIKCFY